MSHNGPPDATGHISSTDTDRAMEHDLHALRSVVCELLQVNQRLREALLATSANPPHGRGTL